MAQMKEQNKTAGKELGEIEISNFYSLTAFKILSLSLTFGSLITICVGVVFFGSN